MKYVFINKSNANPDETFDQMIANHQIQFHHSCMKVTNEHSCFILISELVVGTFFTMDQCNLPSPPGTTKKVKPLNVKPQPGHQELNVTCYSHTNFPVFASYISDNYFDNNSCDN